MLVAALECTFRVFKADTFDTYLKKSVTAIIHSICGEYHNVF